MIDLVELSDSLRHQTHGCGARCLALVDFEQNPFSNGLAQGLKLGSTEDFNALNNLIQPVEGYSYISRLSDRLEATEQARLYHLAQALCRQFSRVQALDHTEFLKNLRSQQMLIGRIKRRSKNRLLAIGENLAQGIVASVTNH